MLTVQGIFDGKKIEVLDTVPFHEKRKVLITFLDDTPQKPASKKRIAGLNKGKYFMADDFDEPLPDAFWVGEE
ncbi:MAG: hypothetical protein AB7S75_17480 [Desulfococcaceae bacterium]